MLMYILGDVFVNFCNPSQKNFHTCASHVTDNLTLKLLTWIVSLNANRFISKIVSLFLSNTGYEHFCSFSDHISVVS